MSCWMHCECTYIHICRLRSRLTLLSCRHERVERVTVKWLSVSTQVSSRPRHDVGSRPSRQHSLCLYPSLYLSLSLPVCMCAIFTSICLLEQLHMYMNTWIYSRQLMSSAIPSSNRLYCSSFSIRNYFIYSAASSSCSI